MVRLRLISETWSRCNGCLQFFLWVMKLAKSVQKKVVCCPEIEFSMAFWWKFMSFVRLYQLQSNVWLSEEKFVNQNSINVKVPKWARLQLIARGFVSRAGVIGPVNFDNCSTNRYEWKSFELVFDERIIACIAWPFYTRLQFSRLVLILNHTSISFSGSWTGGSSNIRTTWLKAINSICNHSSERASPTAFSISYSNLSTVVV